MAEAASLYRSKLGDRVCGRQEVSHVLFPDDEIVVPQDLLNRLLADDVPILVPLFYRATEPHSPLIFKVGPDGEAIPFDEAEICTPPDQPLLECPGGAGTGVMLVHRDVLEAIGDRPFRYPEAGGSADLHFCQCARELGFKTFCSSAITIPQMSHGETPSPD